MAIVTATAWDEFLQHHPEAHLLQTGAWGDFKSAFGWQPERLVAGESGAQVLFRRLPAGFSFAYLPKGPVGHNWRALWPEIDRLCRRKRAVILKVEPDLYEPVAPDIEAQLSGFIAQAEPVQPRRTIVISLAGGEQDWLARMKQKTRYNIRLAE